MVRGGGGGAPAILLRGHVRVREVRDELKNKKRQKRAKFSFEIF
jgi:hypothetical protein